MTRRDDSTGRDDSSEPTTTLLLQRIRDNDQAALGILLKRIEPRVLRWVRRHRGAALKERFETLDLSQEVALELLRYLPTFRCADSALLDRLLLRMIQNTLRDKAGYLMAQRRKITRERPIGSDTVISLDPPAEKIPSPSEVAVRREQHAWLRLVLALLPPAEQQLIIRRRFERHSFVRIAQDMGESSDAVRQRYNRSVARLARYSSLMRSGQTEKALALDDGDLDVEASSTRG